MTSYSWDFKLPEWWYDEDVTDDERSDWLVQERCRRMAQRQYTPYLDARKKKAEREQRKAEAMSDSVDVIR